MDELYFRGTDGKYYALRYRYDLVRVDYDHASRRWASPVLEVVPEPLESPPPNGCMVQYRYWPDHT